MNTETTSQTITRIRDAVFSTGSIEHAALTNAIEAVKLDQLDIAYLSMGALQELDKDGGKIGDDLNSGGWGQIELISAMLNDCMPPLVYHQREIGDSYDGCYAYDVVEPLGMFWVNELHRTGKRPNHMTLLAKCRKYAE